MNNNAKISHHNPQRHHNKNKHKIKENVKFIDCFISSLSFLKASVVWTAAVVSAEYWTVACWRVGGFIFPWCDILETEIAELVFATEASYRVTPIIMEVYNLSSTLWARFAWQYARLIFLSQHSMNDAVLLASVGKM
jgi:hypothetical protein